jgi:predicted nuclease of predicted toxin-antitoxin system
MRVLLDECINVRFRHEIQGHEVVTVEYRGWKSVKNGRLLAAASPEFDVFVTLDTHLQNEQAVEKLDMAVILIRARSNALVELRKAAPALNRAILFAAKGKVTVISGDSA